MKITQERLKQLLRYDPETGHFTWRVNRGPRRAGERAGNVTVIEAVGVDGTLYPAHRLAWLYMTGEKPNEIDHKNGNNNDNRWENLRDGTHAQNCQNRRRALTATGLLGVYPCASGRFFSTIRVEGKPLYLGSFDTKEDAHAAYVSAKRQRHEFCTI